MKGGFEMYSAKEAAEMTGLTTATLRYYEKEQLLIRWVCRMKCWNLLATNTYLKATRIIYSS